MNEFYFDGFVEVLTQDEPHVETPTDYYVRRLRTRDVILYMRRYDVWNLQFFF